MFPFTVIFFVGTLIMNISLALMGMGGGEMVLVFAAILVLFGAKKIPEFAKGLGQGIKEFKKASREVTDEISNATNDAPPAHSPVQTPPAAAPAANAANPPATVPKA
jgi:sec-independent protein translocase protein TatA